MAMRVPSQVGGKCLRLSVTRYSARAACAHSRDMLCVVVRVRAYVQARGWTDPETLFANRAKGAGYDFFRSFEPRAADDLFIFRIDIGANAVPWPSTMLGGSRFSKAWQRQLQNVRLCATWEHRPGSNR